MLTNKRLPLVLGMVFFAGAIAFGMQVVLEVTRIPLASLGLMVLMELLGGVSLLAAMLDTESKT